MASHPFPSIDESAFHPSSLNAAFADAALADAALANAALANAISGLDRSNEASSRESSHDRDNYPVLTPSSADSRGRNTSNGVNRQQRSRSSRVQRINMFDGPSTDREDSASDGGNDTEGGSYPSERSER